MNDNLLEDFLLRIFEDRNVPCHETSRGVFEILLTPELAREQGLPMHLKITGDPEACEEEEGLELVRPGSPLLDWAVREAEREGRLSLLHVEVRSLDAAAARGKLERALVLDRVKLEGIEEVGLELGQVHQLTFRATVVTDLSEDHWIDVPLAGDTGHTLPSWLASGPPALVHPGPVYVAQARPVRSFQSLLEQGQAWARRTLEEKLAPLQSRAKEQAISEEARVKGYFLALRVDLERRKHSPDIHRERLASLDAEEGVRLSEIAQRATLRSSIRLASLTVYETPKVTFRVRLKSGSRDSCFLATMDLATGTPDPLTCPHCQGPTLTFVGIRDEPLRCAACRPPAEANARDLRSDTASHAGDESVEDSRPTASSPPSRPATRGSPAPRLTAARGPGQSAPATPEPAVLEMRSGPLAYMEFHFLLGLNVHSEDARRELEAGLKLRGKHLHELSRVVDRALGLPGLDTLGKGIRSTEVRGASSFVGNRMYPPAACATLWNSARVLESLLREAGGRPAVARDRWLPLPRSSTETGLNWYKAPDGAGWSATAALSVLLVVASTMDREIAQNMSLMYIEPMLKILKEAFPPLVHGGAIDGVSTFHLPERLMLAAKGVDRLLAEPRLHRVYLMRIRTRNRLAPIDLLMDVGRGGPLPDLELEPRRLPPYPTRPRRKRTGGG